MMELLKKSTGTNEGHHETNDVRLLALEVRWREEGEWSGDGRVVKNMMEKENEKRKMESSQAL